MSLLSRIAPWLVPCALWLWLFFHLRTEWLLNPQYHYGWAVPFAAAFLFYLRWADRPPPAPRGLHFSSFILHPSSFLLLLGIRLIEEANPDWRLLSWVFALVVVAYSLFALARAGGGRWARHFAFPVCLPLVAVPWLAQIENAVVQGMTRAVAYAAVEIAGWIGIGAFQTGNVIELHNGLVGVNEACSGVKTLQAAIMVALVLGELLALPASRRIALLIAGCGWVFLCNVLRAGALIIIAANQETTALGHWHDTIGTLVVIAGMAGLIGIAWLLRGDAPASPTPARPLNVSKTSPIGPLAGLAWLVFVFGATELWYRSHERQLIELPAWTMRWPDGMQALPIPDETRAILRYDHAQSAVWENPPGVRWWSFFARWEPQRAALQLVRSHSPEICLPAIGRTFRRELPPVTFETGVLPLRFRVYEFEQRGRALFVFVCIQEDKAPGSSAAAPATEWNARGRLLAAWRGQRNLGQRLLEIAVVGYDDFARAHEAAARSVREMTQPATGSLSG